MNMKTPEFLEMMNRWNEKGFFSKSALSDTDSDKTKNGKAALKVHNVDTFTGLVIDKPEYSFDYANLVKDVSNMAFTQDAMVISNTSKHPERALALWELITTDREAFDAFFYGIEGVSYELNDKGEVKTLDPDNYAASAMWAARTTELNRDGIGTPDRTIELKKNGMPISRMVWEARNTVPSYWILLPSKQNMRPARTYISSTGGLWSWATRSR